MAKTGEVLAVHEIGAHESNEFEKAVLYFRYLAQQVQQQEGDQRGSDLNAHRVLGTADQVRDFQGLLHQAEEQLDLPAPLVEVGDLRCRRVEIVA